MKRPFSLCVGILLALLGQMAGGLFGGQNEAIAKVSEEKGLVAYWKLKGDCKDYSGNGNHGVNHGVDLDTAEFNGSSAYVEVPDSPSLDLGTGDFSICAWVYTDKDFDDVIGDVLSKYDPSSRKGFTLSINASSGGYNSQGDDKHVYFGIDNGKLSDWEDCGRPSETSNYVSNSLTVYRGKLYAAITDAQKKEDWCHVYRYEGGQKWADCGRVGNLRTAGVGPLIVHDGKLYAATWTYDWSRVHKGNFDYCRVYCYEGGKQWKDCGQPGKNRTLCGIASYKGKLYVVGEDGTPKYGGVCLVHEGGREWKVSRKFGRHPSPMAVHDGRLFVGVFGEGVYSYDGNTWRCLGDPLASPEHHNQLHALEVYKGQLYVTIYPRGKVAMYKGGKQWEDCGRLGDGTEINALTVYNGKFYGGSIPRAEVTRYEGRCRWTSMKRFFAPEGWEPMPPGSVTGKGLKEWTRVTSLTVYGGRLFASIGSCTSSVLDAPADVRGKVYSMEAGKCVSYDHDLGSGWKHVAAIRQKGKLKLYVDGQLAATSSSFDPDEYDISTDEPLKIGFGEMDYFSGRIREVRVYNRALNNSEIREARGVCKEGSHL